VTKAQVRKREECCRTRPVLRRLRWMAGELRRKGEMPNCQQLGVRYEVSYKTVSRDIDMMRDFFDYPIRYDAKDYKWKVAGELPEPVL
jgi:predicted DNA-binding transcriptional regulator YafY